MTVLRCCCIAIVLIEIFSERCAARLHESIGIPKNHSKWTNLEGDSPRAILFGRLSRAFTAMIDNLDDIDVDAYFGVVLAKAQLDVILKKEPDIIKMVDFLIEKGPTINQPLGSNLNNVARHILNADKWSNIGMNISKKLNCKIRKNDHEQKAHFYRNSPNATESDMCLSQLIDEAVIKKKVYDSHFTCQISEECHQIMTGGKPWGYALTHRVIYFLVGESQGCKEKSVESLCCNIREEMLSIETKGFSSALRDLFMEQALVCALSGYGEFLQSTWLQHVINWQMDEGCWGIAEKPSKQIILDNDKSIMQDIDHHSDAKGLQDFIRFGRGYNGHNTVRVMRTRRSTQPLGKRGCSSHMTGIGVALMAFAARHHEIVDFD